MRPTWNCSAALPCSATTSAGSDEALDSLMSRIGVVTNFYQLTMTLKYTRSRRKQIFSILSVAKKGGGTKGLFGWTKEIHQKRRKKKKKMSACRIVVKKKKTFKKRGALQSSIPNEEGIIRGSQYGIDDNTETRGDIYLIERKKEEEDGFLFIWLPFPFLSFHAHLGVMMCYYCINVTSNDMCNQYAIERACPTGKKTYHPQHLRNNNNLWWLCVYLQFYSRWKCLLHSPRDGRSGRDAFCNKEV